MLAKNPDSPWHRVGTLDELKQRELQQITLAGEPIALSFKDGKFGAVAGIGVSVHLLAFLKEDAH